MGTRSDEVLQRVRRIETRVTQVALKLGVEVPTRSPVFTIQDDSIAHLNLPTPHSSIKEILDNIPPSWNGPVGVFVGDEWVATIDRSGNRP